MTSSTTRSRSLWKWMLLLLVLCGLALVGLRWYGYSYVSDDVRNTIAEWEQIQVSLPGDWHKPAVLPPDEVQNFHQSLATQMQRVRDKYRLLLSGPDGRSGLLERPHLKLKDDERTSFSLLVAELKPLIKQTSETVNLPGYDFDTDMHLASDAVSAVDVILFAKVLNVMAYEHAVQGDCQRAIQAAVFALKLFQHHEQANLITRMIALDIIRTSAESVYRVCIQCRDRRSLSTALRALNRLREKVLPDATYLEYADLLAPLRYAAAYGYPVDLSPQSYADFARQVIYLYDESNYSRWIIDNLKPASVQVAAARQNLRYLHRKEDFSYSIKTEAQRLLRKPTVFLLATGVDINMARFASFGPDYDEARRRVNHSAAVYDLTRLELARNLVELDGKNTTVTDYLSPVPDDPFTSGPFLFSMSLRKHYSVGPDKVDDKTAVHYDATNGTVSAGDVWMQAR